MREARYLFPLFAALFMSSCAGGSQITAEELAATYVAQTAAASTPTPFPTDTPHPTATYTPTEAPPTATETSEPTRTPTPGPLIFTDDFSTRSEGWLDCGACSWENGALYLGPYSVDGAYMQHNVICGPCGLVRNYRMAVDVAHGDGPSDRGFGLLVRLNDDEMSVLEVTPWQTFVLWRLSPDTNLWDLVDGTFTGRLRPGSGINRIEIVVSASTMQGRSNIALNLGGRSVIVVFNQRIDLGAVGLTIYGHAMQAVFDNFEFEELPPYDRLPIPPAGPPGPSGGLDRAVT